MHNRPLDVPSFAKPLGAVGALIALLVTMVVLTTCSVGLGSKVDITAPALRISSPSSDGTYQRGTIHLAGTVSDDIGVASLKVSWAGTAGQVVKSASPSGASWTLDIPSGTAAADGLPEGTNSITVTSTDASGKATSATRLLYVDNKPPTVLVQSPASHGTSASGAALVPEYSDYIDIKGEIYDASPLQPVTITLYRADNSVLATKAADGTSTFSARFILRKDDDTGLPAAGLLGHSAAGSVFRYTVSATDAAGNSNGGTYHRQDIYSVMPSGTLFPTVSDLAAIDGTAGTSSTGITSASLASILATTSPPVYDFLFQYTSSPRIEFINVDANSTTNTLGVSGILTATIQPPATAGSSMEPNSVVSKVYQASDLVHPVMTLQGTTTNQDLRIVGDSLSYSLTLKNGTAPLSPGTYRLVLSAQATGSSVATKQVDFTIDSGAPYLDLSAIVNPGAYVKSATTLAGAAASQTGLQKLDVFQAYNGGVGVLVQTIPLSGTASSWSATPTPVAGSPDGSYDYTATLTTTSGKTTSVFHSLTLDTVGPTVSVNSVSPTVGNGAISGTSTTFNLGASDTNGVTEVRWWLLPASDPTPTWSSAGYHAFTAPPYTVSNFDSTPASVGEGQKLLWVLARDKAGNESSTSQSLWVDQTLPALEETAAGPLAATVKASQTFAGNASDSDGLASLVVSVDGATPQTIAVAADKSWIWTYAIDAVHHTQDGNHTFTFTATDVAGRTSSAIRTTKVDTQAPTVTVGSPTSGGWVAASALAVLGTASDGAAGSGTAIVYIKVDGRYAAGTSTDHSTENPAAAGWQVATSTGNWTANLTLTGEGQKTLWTKAVDAAGNLTSASEAVAARVDFGLDLNPPTLNLTTDAPALAKDGFTVTGTATDTNTTSAPTMAIAVDGGLAQSLPVAAGTGTWSYTFSPSSDGNHTLVFTATDAANKTTTLSRTVQVDTTKPSVAIVQPGSFAAANASYWLSGATAAFSGSASDSGTGSSGVASVRFLVSPQTADHTSDNPLTAPGWGPAGGATTWTTTIDLATLGEGQFTLWVASVDNAGNLATVVHQDFGVDQSVPSVTETSRSAVSSSKVAFGLLGMAGDTNALASLTMTEKKDSAVAQAVTLNPSTVSGTSTAWSSPTLPLGGVADGSYQYTIVAKDVAGKATTVTRTVTIDTTPPTVTLSSVPTWVTSSAYTISGTATDPNSGASGVASVEYRLDGGSWITAQWTDTSGGANTSGTWNATLTGLTEGNHTLAVRSTDKASNGANTSTSFGVDLGAPTLTETLLGTGAQVSKNAAFTLTGAVSDTNPVSVAGSTLAVSVSVNGGAATAASVSAAGWTFTQPKVDGTYSYVITATDAAGRTTTVNRLVLLDSTPPSLTVSAPSAGLWASSPSVTITGTALDGAGSGIDRTYVLVDSVTADHTADIAAWNSASGAGAPSSSTSATWAVTSGLPTLWTVSAALTGEGLKRLWVVSVDKAGNSSTPVLVTAGGFAAGSAYTIATLGATDFTLWGATANTVGLSFNATGAGSLDGTTWSSPGLVFGYDAAVPVLTETVVGGPSVTTNTSLVFGGSASDSDGLASAHKLTVVLDGGTPADVAFTAEPSWSYTLAVDTSGHTTDGSHTVTFTATDVAGKTTTVTRTVVVDTTPATATVSSPAASSWTNVSPATVQGTATDGSGVGVAQVWTLAVPTGGNHSGDTPTTITTGGAWKKATNTTNWSSSWSLGAEGPKTLWLAVVDGAGNWSTPAAVRSFGYDATAPNLTLDALGGYSAAFSISGTGGDSASGISALQVKVDSGTLASASIGATWSYALSAAAFAALSEGSHAVTVVATDGAGNQTILSGSFTKDATPPALSYSNISIGGGSVVQDTSPVLTGTLNDPSGVASATYTLQVWNAATSTWTTLTSGASLGTPAGSTSYSWSINLAAGAGVPDGRYQVTIGAADGAANAIASPVAVPFLVSRTNPAAAVATPALGTYQNGAFSLVGTASDPNGVTQVRAKVALGSVDFGSGATSALPASPATVTLGTPGVFTTPWAHGLAVGDTVYLGGSALPVASVGSLSAGAAYFVQSVPSSTTFTLGLTSGGAALSLVGSPGTDLLVAASKDTFASFHHTLPVAVLGATLTAANHHLVTGDVVYLGGTALPTPGTAGAYYVVNPTANTFQIALTAGGAAVTFTAPGTSVNVWSPTQGVSWVVPVLSVAGQSDGALTAYVQVTGGSAKSNQTSRDFTLDTTAPTMALTSPTSGARTVGNLTLVGTTTDGGTIPSGVTGTIKYQVGKNYNLANASSWTSANVSGGSYSWTISLGDMSGYANPSYATETDSSGNPASGTNLWRLPIVFQSVDKAGNLGQLTTYYLLLDPNGNVPILTITQPTSGITVGGQVRISGTASQPVWVHDVEVSEDPTNTGTFTTWQPATLITTGNNVMWYYDINKSNLYPQSGSNQTVQVQVRGWNSPTANGTRGTIAGVLSSPFVLNFNSTFPKIQDVKVNGSSYYSQFTTHGEINATATVSSSKGIAKIEAVESSPLSGATTLYDSSSASFVATTMASKAGFWSSTVTGPAPLTAGSFPFGGSYRVLITSLGNTDWTAIGGPATPTVGASFAPTGPGTGTGQAIASDATGNFIYSVALALHSTALFTGTSGVYSVDLRATDWGSPAQVSTSTLTLNEDNFAPTTTLTTPATVTAGSLVTGKRYLVTSLGTSDFRVAGARANALGQSFVATGAGSGTGTVTEVLTGTSLKIQGSATDVGSGSGQIGGLSKVVVYLTRGTSILDIRTGGASTTGTTLAVTDFANGGSSATVVYPVTSSYSNYFASIDNTTEIGFTDVNGDGFLESLLTNGNAKDWWTELDTTLLPDGPVTVHEVIWDNAGNASHYAQSTFISNNAPVLTSIDVGTDLNGDGTVAAGEMTNYPAGSAFAASGFTVRNSRLYFKANYSKGTNAPMRFSVTYGGVEQNASLTSSSVTLTDFSGIPDSTGTNDRTFTLYVYDSTAGTTPGTDSQGFVQTVGLNIKNFDTAAPRVQLAPFGLRWSAPIDAAGGNVNTDAGKTLGPVSAYTDNVPGVLGALAGHVEYATDSRYNPLAVTLSTPSTGSFTNTGTNGLKTNSVVYFAWATAPASAPSGTGPYYVIGTPTATSFQVSSTLGGPAAVFGTSGTGLQLATPDLSGKVFFRGRIADDQKIANLSATIPGYNGGNAFTLATWSSSANAGSGGLVGATGTDWAFSVDSGTESVSQAGHVANWSFTFDTSKIDTVAAANLPVTFAATDGGGNTSVSSMNVDVVPYITDFSRQAPFTGRLVSNNMNPGAGGYYPVYQGGSGYTISGFNLYYATANVTVGTTALTVTSPSTTSLTAAIPSSLLPVVGASSANLSVTTNGIASINNNTAFTSPAATNANGVLFSSYLTEEGSFTNDRKVYVDDQAPTIGVADFGLKYPVQATDDATNGAKSTTAATYPENVPYSGITSTRSDGATTATWLGHLAYKADGSLTAGRAVVSGVVTFKGKAMDNERVAKITATIPGFDGGKGTGAEFEIYTLANGFEYFNGSGFASTGSGYTASGSASALLGTKGWTAWADGTDYKLVDSTRVAQGHVLNWNFSWDSSKIATVAALGVVVTFKVYDANATAHTASTWITVDVAPYVTGVTTLLSNLSSSNPSVYNRTALGKYPVNSNETISLSGFNLTGATITGLSGVTVTGGVVSAPMAAAATGSLPLLVNSVPLLNNVDVNTYDFNKWPNGVNNNLLTDDVSLDVWQFNSRAAVPVSGQVSDPVMRVNPVSGKLGFAFTNGPLYFSMGGTVGGTEYSYNYWQASFDFLTSVAFTYDSAGHTYGSAAGGDINSGSADKFTLMTDRWGRSGTDQNGSYGGANALRLESIGLNNSGTYDFDKYRIKSPNFATSRLATGATSTNLYMAYFDNMQSEIAFRYGNLLDSAGKTNFTPQTVVAAGAFVTGKSYTIASVGSTNFTSIGAASTTVGLTFTATGAGTGSGTATLNSVAPTLVTAGSFVVGRSYIIQSVGTTSFTSVGSSANTIGTTFTATGVGSGTGTAYTTSYPNFYDSDQAGTPPVYSNTYKQIVAGSTTGRAAGEFVSLGVVSDQTVAATALVAGGTYIVKSVGTTSFTSIGASANTVGTVFTATGAGAGTGTVSSDVVVMVWYDATNQCLWYTYNTTPTVNRSGTATAAGWSTPLKIFSNAGQYCQVAVDVDGGIHIAAYDINNANLLYAYLSNYAAGSAATSVVDAYGIVGTNITLDVAKVGTKNIPYIGYYALSSIRPKYAYLVDTGTAAPAGASNDYFTGSWEVTLLPTASSVPQDRINAAVWKTSAGVLTTSTSGTSSYTQTGSGYSATNYGVQYGNGTNNGVLAYQIKESTKGYIETAQKK